MDDCHFHELARDIEDFVVEDLSRWYVKKVRGRIKNGDEAAIWTLEKVLKKITKLTAPFSPFISERIYQDLEGDLESVHMEDYPETDENRVDESLEEGMDTAREIVEKSTKIRDENQYNLRWPAKRLVISTSSQEKERIERFEDLIKDMANVKKIEYGEVASEMGAKPDYSKLGPKFGENADDVAEKIEELEHDQIEQLQTTGELELENYKLEPEDVKVESNTAEDVGSKSIGKGEIFLDLQMTEEIEEEAFVAEVIRAIQQKRKDEDLEVEDEVDLSFKGDTEALEEYSDLIENRVNLNELDFIAEDLEYSGEVEFRNYKTVFRFSEPKA
jgi:isoleucyl-tRNA synthetase